MQQPGFTPAPPAPQSSTARPGTTNVLAVVALCLSLLAILLCVTAPIGAVLGHVARRQARERSEHGEGMALAAIIVGWIGFGLTVVFVGAFVAYVITHPSDGHGNGGGFDDMIRLGAGR